MMAVNFLELRRTISIFFFFVNIFFLPDPVFSQATHINFLKHCGEGEIACRFENTTVHAWSDYKTFSTQSIDCQITFQSILNSKRKVCVYFEKFYTNTAGLSLSFYNGNADTHSLLKKLHHHSSKPQQPICSNGEKLTIHLQTSSKTSKNDFDFNLLIENKERSTVYMDSKSDCDSTISVYDDSTNFTVKAWGHNFTYLKMGLSCKMVFENILSYDHQLCVFFPYLYISKPGINLKLYGDEYNNGLLKNLNYLSRHPNSICSTEMYLTVLLDVDYLASNNYDFKIIIQNKKKQKLNKTNMPMAVLIGIPFGILGFVVLLIFATYCYNKVSCRDSNRVSNNQEGLTTNARALTVVTTQTSAQLPYQTPSCPPYEETELNYSTIAETSLIHPVQPGYRTSFINPYLAQKPMQLPTPSNHLLSPPYPGSPEYFNLPPSDPSSTYIRIL